MTVAPLPPANPNNPPIVGTQPVRIETETDEKGDFSIDGLAPGPYRLQAKGDTLGSAESRHLDLSAGQRLRELEVVLSDTVLIQGTVRRAGVPTADISLSFDVRGTPTVPEGHSVLYPFARSGPDGRYQVRLEPGAIVDRVLVPWPRKQAPPGFLVTGPRSSVDIDIP